MKHPARLFAAAAAVAVLGLASSGFALDTELTDYSWAVLKDNPKFYWNFNETGAGDAAVELVRGIDSCELVPYLNATRTAGNAGLGQTASFDGVSLFGSAGYTDATTGDTELGLNRGWNCGAYAIELWMKSDGTDGGQYVVNTMGEAYAGDWPALIYNYTADTPSLWTHTGKQSGAGGMTISDTEWHHVVFTVYGNGAGDGTLETAKNQAIYGRADRVDAAIDGNVVTNICAGSLLNTIYNFQGALFVGAHNYSGNSGFSGSIDELAIYELGGLTEAELAAKHVELAGHYDLAASAPAANVAFVDNAQVSYTWVGGSPANDYPDSTGRELVDGAFSDSLVNLNAGTEVGYSGNEGYVELVFDLGDSVTLDSIWIDYLGGGKWGVDAPKSVEFTFSTDGVNFSDAQTFDDFNNDTAWSGGWEWFSERRLTAEVGGVTASHVKMVFDKTDSTFNFLSEVQFLEAVPEPGTFALLFAGFVTALACRRR